MRYGLALLMLMAAPMAVCYWTMVHTLTPLWRKLGIAGAYCVMVPILCLVVFTVFSHRAALLAVDFGTDSFLILIGEMLILTDIWLFALVTRNLPFRTFLGLPEIDPKKHPIKLITGGIYSRIRHPRYAQVLVMIFSCSLITNYAATYLLVPLSLLGFYWIAKLEERELIARFGQQYLDYRAQTAMFIPKL